MESVGMTLDAGGAEVEPRTISLDDESAEVELKNGISRLKKSTGVLRNAGSNV